MTPIGLLLGRCHPDPYHDLGIQHHRMMAIVMAKDCRLLTILVGYEAICILYVLYSRD